MRNKASHGGPEKQIKTLDEYFPDILKKIDLVKQCTKYATEVCETITKEVDKATQKTKNINNNATEMQE